MTTDLVLSYALYPDLLGTVDDIVAGSAFASTATSIEVIFDDGTSSIDAARDQAGYPTSTRGQYESRALTVDQWNLRRVSLAPFVGLRAIAVRLRVNAGWGQVPAEGPASSGWVSDITLQEEPVHPIDDAIDLVDTRRGSHSSDRASRGNTVPMTGVPHGFSFAIPVTDAAELGWPYRYHAEDELRLEAVAVSHLPSPWMGDRGVVQIMPVAAGAGADADRTSRGLMFRHDDETASPHLWSVRTMDGTSIELTATDRVLVARFSSPTGAGVIIDQIDDRGRLFVHPGEKVTFTGYTDSARPNIDAHAPRTYFAVMVDEGVTDVRTGTALGREHVSASATIGGSGPATVRVASSFISIDQARRNLASEAPESLSFDDVAAAARERWSALLGTVTVDGDRALRAAVASDLYRMFLYPNEAHENAGDVLCARWVHADTTDAAPRAHGEESTGCSLQEGESYVNNGFWDTYRTVWPAYSLFVPERAAAMLDGFLAHYRSSGWMARWSSPGPADAMVGTSSDIIFADAISSGVKIDDPRTAYESALRNATTMSARSQVGRADGAHAPFRGFVSSDTPEGLSWTLEGAVNDFGLSRLACELALAEIDTDKERLETEARWFAARAAQYTALFDPETRFFVSRSNDGRFETGSGFDERRWGGGYTETNAWGMRFSVPHDGAGLATLLGGGGALCDALDEYFRTPETADIAHAGTYGRVIHEMTEARDLRMGMFGLSNQPAHHIPFMYKFSDTPWVTDAIVRESVRRMFLGSEIGQGFPGDEDNGEMSAWHLFATIGLYPLTPGSGELVIVSPSSKRAVLYMPGGRQTVIDAPDWTHDHTFIQAVRVDGAPWVHAAIPIALIRRGVRIEIDLGPEPAAWAQSAPFSLTPPGEPPAVLVDATHGAHATSANHLTLIDDDARTGIMMVPGQPAVFDLASPTEIAMYTVTLAAAGIVAPWRVEGRVDDDWVVLDERHTEHFAWPDQTRPFTPARTAVVTAVRFTMLLGSTEVRQLEFLEDRPAMSERRMSDDAR